MSDYLLKLNRAHHHLQQLDNEIRRWFNGDNHRVILEPQPQGPPDYQLRVEIGTLPNDPFSLIIGDILQNTRACLDHIAFAMADIATSASGASKDFIHDSEFPIVGNESRKGQPTSGASNYPNIEKVKLASVPSGAQTIIQGLQPYHRGNDFRSHPLWQLQELCVIDKHHLIHPVTYYFGGVAIQFDSLRQYKPVPPLNVHGGPLENNTVVMRFRAEVVDPDSDVEMQLDPDIGVTIEQGTCVSGENVLDVLGGIYNFVIKDIIEQLLPFLPNHDAPPARNCCLHRSKSVGSYLPSTEKG